MKLKTLGLALMLIASVLVLQVLRIAQPKAMAAGANSTEGFRSCLPKLFGVRSSHRDRCFSAVATRPPDSSSIESSPGKGAPAAAGRGAPASDVSVCSSPFAGESGD